MAMALFLLLTPQLLHRYISNHHLVLFLLILCADYFPTSTVFADGSHNIMSYGAKPDGRTDSSDALMAAWSAACRGGGGDGPHSNTVYVPPGKFLVDGATLRGPCKGTEIEFRINGTIVAHPKKSAGDQWLHIDKVVGLSIYGGTIDGSGAATWAKNTGAVDSDGSNSLLIRHSRNVNITGLKSVNSKKFHIVVDRCHGVTMRDVHVTAPGDSPNTDGIHIARSSDVSILGADIETGDDCVSIGAGVSNIWIEGIECGPGHGISIGSLGKKKKEQGVTNVMVTAATFRGTKNGFRIKTWQRRATTTFVDGVVFQQTVMWDVSNPIVIDQNYCPHKVGCSSQASGVRISNVTYSDIEGSSATEVALKFDCSRSNPCHGIVLRDIDLTYKDGDQPAKSLCNHANGVASGVVEPSSCL